MSDYQHERGRLISVEKDEKETVKEYFQRVLVDDFEEEHWDNEEPKAVLYESDNYEKYFYIKEVLYKVLEIEKVDPYDDIQILRGDPKGGYWFEMKYYDGGTCLSEMIEESLEKL